jgi:hypothetical protein
MTDGNRFSQIYLERGTPVNDSIRMRNRISAIYDDLLKNDAGKIITLIHQTTGAKVPYLVMSYDLARFFEHCEIRDLLDSITIIRNYFIESRQFEKANRWHHFISKVFIEENVGYRLDKTGVVHFYIDEEFEHNRYTIIAGLSSQPAVKETFLKAYFFLDQDEPDTSSAIRSIFESLEILYKHIVEAGGKDRLNSMGVKNKLKPLLQQSLINNPIAFKAVDHLMDSLCNWIEAGHIYRHGQKIEEPSPPPLDYTVLFLSQGTSFLRYLLPFA